MHISLRDSGKGEKVSELRKDTNMLEGANDGPELLWGVNARYLEGANH